MANEKSDRKAQKSYRAVRTAVLVFFLVLSTALGIMHQYSTVLKPVGVDALDPFGAIESTLSVLVSGNLLEKIAWTSFILLLATLIAAVLFRRVFCGEICAFGALQEVVARLGRRIFRKRLAVPEAIDKPARFLKYAILVVVVVMSFATASLWIRPYDPWAAYHHIVSVELVSGYLVGLILLIVSLAGSLLYDRFFCKYLCPMGGFLGLINRIGWFRIKRVDATCTHCMACNKACPVNIKVESVAQVSSSECINCNLCVASCPVKDTLVVEGPRRGRISPQGVLWITVADLRRHARDLDRGRRRRSGPSRASSRRPWKRAPSTRRRSRAPTPSSRSPSSRASPRPSSSRSSRSATRTSRARSATLLTAKARASTRPPSRTG